MKLHPDHSDISHDEEILRSKINPAKETLLNEEKKYDYDKDNPTHGEDMKDEEIMQSCNICRTDRYQLLGIHRRVCDHLQHESLADEDYSGNRHAY